MPMTDHPPSRGRWIKRAAAGLRSLTERATAEQPGSGGYVPGLVSVVVPAYNVADYLDECLTSLREQRYAEVEIVVVDDGSPDDSAAIAARHAQEDDRVRLVRRDNGGLSAARNTGVRAARGEFLAFVDADDTVSRVVFSAPVKALAESGSDFAVTTYDRLERDGRLVRPAPWIRAAHATRRLATTLEAFPDVMVNAVAWSKVYRRSFWDAAGLSFPVGRIYEDQPVSMAAFARARSFDVLKEVGVHWRVRGDGSSISQGGSSVRNLVEHNLAVRASLDALRDAGHAAAADARAVQLLANNLPPFVRHVAEAGEEFWEELRVGVGMLAGLIDAEVYRSAVNVGDKVLYALVLADRREDAIAFLAEAGTDLNRFRAVCRADGLHAELPHVDGLPDGATVIAERQVILQHRILQIDWDADGSLRLTGWAYLRCIDLVEHPPSLRIELVGPDGRRRPLQVTGRAEARADVSGNHAYADYRPGGFTAVLPAAEVPTEPGEHLFELVMTAAGITRTATVDMMATRGSAALAHSRVLPDGGIARVVHDRPKPHDPTTVLHLRTSRSATYATEVTRDEGPTSGAVTVTFVASEPSAVHLAHIDHPEPLLSVAPTRAGDRWQARFDLGRLPRGPLPGLTAGELGRPLRFRVEGPGGTSPLLAPAAVEVSPGLGDDGTRAVTRGRTGELEVFDWWPAATAYDLGEDRLAVTVSHARALAGTPVLRTREETVTGRIEPGEDGADTLVFALTRDRWGRAGLGIPSGRYQVGIEDPEGRFWGLTPAPGLLATLPHDRLIDRYRVRLELTASVPPALTVELGPPLGDDERGRRNQRLLAERSRVPRAEDDSVLLRSGEGRTADGNPLAVHRELARRSSALRLCWSVVDRSVPLPPGAVGLVEGSRAWHAALARSRYLVVDAHQPEGHVRPTGQVIVRTLRDHPVALMGHARWERDRVPFAEVASLDRRARDWDVIVSPGRWATPLLRAAYLDPAGAQPQVLEVGQPHDDVLLAPEAQAARESARAALGVAPDRTAVLYAPGPRDHLAARRVELLDAERLVAALGGDVVVLDHADGSAPGRREPSPGVVDVRSHPDPDELLLAADVAVLDYSALRFDLALADRPMVFLVPDRERHDEAGDLVDFDATTPGPQVATTDEVVALLRDLPGLNQRYAEARQRLRETFAELADGRASVRLVDAVFAARGDAPQGDGAR